ncbi:MAG: ParB family transcriptional regulator, chromosome partitioning protein [Acidobacteriota bacterium]|jgi:ParB family chromosome partitioning protein|nr:ParB family transcriptional regulator, chromosome partitioning protein [Acidobacteriota bacterium]
MRHDSHYVEELSSQSPKTIGRLIAVEQLDPNPEQPRVEIGDLTELTTSVKEKGVLEPLLVKPTQLKGRWMIIAGERRWRAARAAGLREVPCIEMDVDEAAVAEIALIENMQRKDLTPWEEADGLAALCQRYGYTHEDVSRKVGKSRSTVTEAIALAAIPEEIREECRRADIKVKSLLLQIVRQSDTKSMREMIKILANRDVTRDEARMLIKERRYKEGDSEISKPFIFRYHLSIPNVKVEVRFSKSEVEKAEIVNVLRSILIELENS